MEELLYWLRYIIHENILLDFINMNTIHEYFYFNRIPILWKDGIRIPSHHLHLHANFVS